MLTLPTTHDLAIRLSVARRAIAVALVTTGGPVSEAKRAAATEGVAREVDHRYGPAELDADLIAFGDGDLSDHLAPLAHEITTQAKEGLLATGLRLAAADGEIGDVEAVAHDAGRALLMTPAPVDGVILQARQSLAGETG